MMPAVRTAALLAGRRKSVVPFQELYRVVGLYVGQLDHWAAMVLVVAFTAEEHHREPARCAAYGIA